MPPPPPADPFAAALEGAFVIAGPTAVGKTGLAVALAQEWGAEIVGADAFQVYQGLDLLTAKPTAQELAAVRHHLVGVIPLGEPFHVQRYVELARAAILDIHARGRRVLIVGGTGMYLRALLRGLDETPPGDPALRATLAQTPLAELTARLQELDPQTTVDLQNPRRVIRALEVCLLSGRPFSSFRTEWEGPVPVRGVALTRPREELYKRIDERAAALFAHGVVEEVAAAETGPSAQQVIGWREIQAHLRGELTQAQCVAQIAQATRHYAKRQLTWFRREPMLQALSLSANTDNPLVLLRRLAATAAALPPLSSGSRTDPPPRL